MKFAGFGSVCVTLLIFALVAPVSQAQRSKVPSNSGVRSNVTPAAPLLSFTPANPSGYDSQGAGADNVIMADVNGDGILDAIVCNTTGYTVFFGNGDGTFTFNNNYPTAGTGANLMAVADLTGNGILDIVATTNYNANGTNGGVDVLLGNGDGTFQQPNSYNAGPIETFAIAVGDVNNDGIPDLVVTSNCQNSTCLNGNVSVLLGKGAGAFTPGGLPLTIAAGTGPVALADMNSDGNLDIVFSGGVLLGDGTGDFTPVSGGELLGGATSIAIADVNKDGILDVLETSNDNEVDVLLGVGNGTLQQFGNYKIGGSWPLFVTVVDINNDGLPDLVVGNECQFNEKQSGGNKGQCNTVGSVAVLTNKGGVGASFAGFNAAQTFPSGGYEASSVAVGDVNGDGKPDFVISDICINNVANSACASDGWMAVLLNSSTFTTTTSVSASPNPAFVNQSVLITATVTSSSGSAITNGDTVTFTQGTTTLGSATTTNGVATLNTSFPKAGNLTIKANFAGDAWNRASSGTTLDQVQLYPSSTTVTSSPNPSTYKEAVTFTATVSSAAPGGPTGTVRFTTTSGSLGTATLSGGTATFTYIHFSALPVGSDTVTATYEGDTQSAKSSGTTVQTVNP